MNEHKVKEQPYCVWIKLVEFINVYTFSLSQADGQSDIQTEGERKANELTYPLVAPTIKTLYNANI